MSTNSNSKNIVSSTPLNTSGTPEVRFRKREFDVLIERHGNDVYLDYAVKCPCKSVNGDHALTTCLNCGGSGWTYINRKKTKMILQSMNVETKYKEWTEQKLGTVKVTASETEVLSFMDRITVIEGEAIISQVLFPQMIDGIYQVGTLYDIIAVLEIFAFDTDRTKLIKLQPNEDYTISSRNILQFNSSYNTKQDFTISVRYKYAPQYLIQDINRETMSVNVRDSKGDVVDVLMPISATGRKSHYVLDENAFRSSILLDNSYSPSCGLNYTFNPTGDVTINNSEGDLLATIQAGFVYTLQPSRILQEQPTGDPTFVQLLHPGEDYLVPISESGAVSLRYSDGSDTGISIQAPSNYNLPIHTIKRSDGSTITQGEFDEDTVVQNSVIKNTSGTTIGSVMADSTVILDDVIHRDSDDQPVELPIGTPMICTIQTVIIKYSTGITATTVTAPGSIVIAKHSAKRTNNTVISQAEFNEDIVIPNSTVTNSLDAILATVMADSSIELPDITHTDSDQSEVTLPAGVPMICSVQSVTIKREDLTVVEVKQAPGDYIVPTHKVSNSDDSWSVNEEFDSNTVVPDINAVNTLGQIVKTGPSAIDMILSNINVQQVNGTTTSLPAGTNAVCQWISFNIVDTAGGVLVNVNAFPTVPITIPDAIVNRDGVSYGTVKPGQTINVISSGITPSGILYADDPISISGVSYVTNDYGSNVQSGKYNRVKPTNPATIQTLDLSNANNLGYLLTHNNSWGHKFRFTGVNGGYFNPTDNNWYTVAGVLSTRSIQVPDNVIYDHYTGKKWYDFNLAATTWSASIPNPATSIAGDTGWMLADVASCNTILILTGITSDPPNKAFVNLLTTAVHWTSCTVPNATTSAYAVSNTAKTITIATKTASRIPTLFKFFA